MQAAAKVKSIATQAVTGTSPRTGADAATVAAEVVVVSASPSLTNRSRCRRTEKIARTGLKAEILIGKSGDLCDYITKPRVQAAITGKTPNEQPIKVNYRFTDEFPNV